MKYQAMRKFPPPWIGVTGVAPSSGLMALFAHGTRLGSAQRSEPSSRLTTSRKVHEGPVQTTQSLDNYSDYEDMECCLARGGKEHELVREVER